MQDAAPSRLQPKTVPLLIEGTYSTLEKYFYFPDLFSCASCISMTYIKIHIELSKMKDEEVCKCSVTPQIHLQGTEYFRYWARLQRVKHDSVSLI